MNNSEIITDRTYPIEPIWILKTTLPSMIGMILPFAYSLFFILPVLSAQKKQTLELPIYVLTFCVLWVIPIPLHFLYNVARRKNFHFAIEEKFLTARQGVFAKQTIHIPYGVIQNVIVSQNFLDRFFGLFMVRLENASQNAGSADVISQMQYKQSSQREEIGFHKNSIEIPGLTQEHAQALKSIILEKIKENPMEDLGL